MANYYSTSRSNYFAVTDEEKFKDIMSRVTNDISFWDVRYDDGTVKFAFGGYDTISDFWYNDEDGECCDGSEDEFFEELGAILPDGEACIYMFAGSEKLRYVDGGAFVVTNSGYEYVSLNEMALSKAREILRDPEWTTKSSY